MTSFERPGDLYSRRIDRRAFLRATGTSLVAGGALYAAACGGGGNQPPATATSGQPTPGATAGAGSITPALLTGEFVANTDNRFAVGLLDGERNLVKDADVHVRFFTIGADGQTGTFRGEGDMSFVELNVEGAHVHDGSGGAATADDSVAFYVVNTPFDVAGKWGVEIGVKQTSGDETKIQAPFEVLEKPNTPAIGAAPPASQNDTAATNPNTESLCSRDPICGLHDLVIGDVLGNGRPLVVQFSTPAFCQTRFCGPVLEVLLSQIPNYRDRVDFVHIEVWRDFQLQQYRPAML
ncbi:MAG TPA: hypothetical protein VIH21_03295, partial [Dehalococcoidia bacterium]